MEVDFNQGLDARLLTEEAADLISKMDIPRIRLAYDEPSDRTPVKKVIKLLKQKGIPGRRLFVYIHYTIIQKVQMNSSTA
jgi:hypothetical protein